MIVQLNGWMTAVNSYTYTQINIWMAVTWIPQKCSYFAFFDTVHLVFWHLVLPADGDVTATELADGLMLATSTAAVTAQEQWEGIHGTHNYAKLEMHGKPSM